MKYSCVTRSASKSSILTGRCSLCLSWVSGAVLSHNPLHTVGECGKGVGSSQGKPHVWRRASASYPRDGGERGGGGHRPLHSIAEE